MIDFPARVTSTFLDPVASATIAASTLVRSVDVYAITPGIYHGIYAESDGWGKTRNGCGRKWDGWGCLRLTGGFRLEF